MADYYTTDEQQVERLRKWWKEYGWATTLGVVIAIVIVVGWQMFRRHELAKAQQASLVYATMMSADYAQQTDVASQAADILKKKFSGTSYADLANLWSAQNAVSKQQYPAAIQSLEAVRLHGHMTTLRQIAAIREAQIDLQLKKPAQAITRLSTVYDKAYQPQIDEVIGDAYLMQTKTEAARTAYENALAGFTKLHLSSSLLEMKLANLPATTAQTTKGEKE